MRVAHMIAKEESWYSSMLMASAIRSVIPAIDKLVLIDNGCSDTCIKICFSVLNELELAGKQLDVKIHREEKDFSKLRNMCLERSEPGDLILKLDADDGHYAEGISNVFNHMESNSDIGCVLAQFIHHRRDPSLQDKSGTHLKDIFFRQTPDMKWEKGVHEGITGIIGSKVNSTYLYHHFGYTKPREELLAHWINYDILEFGEVRRYNLKSFEDLDPNEDLHGQFKVEENKPYNGEYPPEFKWMFDGTMDERKLRWTERGLEGSEFNPLKEYING